MALLASVLPLPQAACTVVTHFFLASVRVCVHALCVAIVAAKGALRLTQDLCEVLCELIGGAASTSSMPRITVHRCDEVEPGLAVLVHCATLPCDDMCIGYAGDCPVFPLLATMPNVAVRKYVVRGSVQVRLAALVPPLPSTPPTPPTASLPSLPAPPPPTHTGSC